MLLSTDLRLLNSNNLLFHFFLLFISCQAFLHHHHHIVTIFRNKVTSAVVAIYFVLVTIYNRRIFLHEMSDQKWSQAQVLVTKPISYPFKGIINIGLLFIRKLFLTSELLYTFHISSYDLLIFSRMVLTLII